MSGWVGGWGVGCAVITVHPDLTRIEATDVTGLERVRRRSERQRWPTSRVQSAAGIFWRRRKRWCRLPADATSRQASCLYTGESNIGSS